jgi:hypothetical protein
LHRLQERLCRQADWRPLSKLGKMQIHERSALAEDAAGQLARRFITVSSIISRGLMISPSFIPTYLFLNYSANHFQKEGFISLLSKKQRRAFSFDVSNPTILGINTKWIGKILSSILCKSFRKLVCNISFAFFNKNKSERTE